MSKGQPTIQTICSECQLTFSTFKNKPSALCPKCKNREENREYQKTAAYRTSLAKYRKSKKYLRWYFAHHPYDHAVKKVCSECKTTFSGHPGSDNTLCKKCYWKAYILKHHLETDWLERRRADSRKHYRSEAYRRWREKNTEKLKAYRHKRYLEHKWEPKEINKKREAYRKYYYGSTHQKWIENNKERILKIKKESYIRNKKLREELNGK